MMYLSRAVLRRDAGLGALAPILLPHDADLRAATAHRVVWALFGDDPQRRRDYLWREEEPGRFLVLSPQPPNNSAGLFEVETKEFAPALAVGDRLAYRLRVNAAGARRERPGQRGRRVDIAARALRGLSGSARADARGETTRQAALAWLARHASTKGFEPAGDLRVLQDEWRRIPRAKGSASFGTLDLAGTLAVTDPEAFVAALASGFGRAKAFGCGLMLIRRAPS